MHATNRFWTELSMFVIAMCIIKLILGEINVAHLIGYAIGRAIGIYFLHQ